MKDFKSRNEFRGRITSGEIKRAYIKAFRIPRWRVWLSDLAQLVGVGGIFSFADATYREMDEGALRQFLEQDRTDLEKYSLPDFDCDDFEFRLHGVIHTDRDLAAMPIFITWVYWIRDGKWVGHALKSYYWNGIVKMVEPQNDIIFAVPEHYRLQRLMG